MLLRRTKKVFKTLIFNYCFLIFLSLSPISKADERLPVIEEDNPPSEEIKLELNTLVITTSGEEQVKANVPESVDVLSREDIKKVAPSHPSELLNRSAGVHINNLGGEGHMTAIRQPITTGAVYLFLEDGIPTRPTGFFNHNALYEINIPHASKVEIVKGPGSALYGSDAIGGVINSVTQPSPEVPEVDVSAEVGSHGWKRFLLSGGAPVNDQSGYRVDLNLTDNDGYRDESDYQRESLTGRYDAQLNANSHIKALVSHSQVSQSGTSSLEENVYRRDPTFNHFRNDIAFREVNATRLSFEYERFFDEDRSLTVTPFFRQNQMDLMPSWMIMFDPNLRDYEFESYGVLTKYRRSLSNGLGQWVLGLDADYTPSTYVEYSIEVDSFIDSRFGETVYTDFRRLDKNYDFDADQTSLSPYVHIDWALNSQLQASLGLRYDYFEVDYHNNLTTLAQGRHIRPESQQLSYDHLSPKAGLVWHISEDKNAYASYRHAFRAPSVGRLFRSGSSINTPDLSPVKSDSFELGFRHQLNFDWYYEIAVYHQTIEDDIVSIIDGSDRKTLNAGETEHQGIELSVQGHLSSEWTLHTALSYSEHTYKDFGYIFSCFPPTCVPPVRETRNFSGFEVGKAPETLGNVSLQYQPASLPKATFEIEYEHVGDYFTDETNTSSYEGHDLYNIRARYDLNTTWQISLRALNITDELYSTYTSNQVGSDDITFRPGLPRSYFLNISAKW